MSEEILPMLAQFILFDGFDPLDVVAPYDLLESAGEIAGGALRVELVSAEGAREVVSGVPGISLRAAGPLDPSRADLVVLPGAYGSMADDAGLTDEEREKTIPAILARTLETDLPRLLGEALGRDGVTVAAVCGGTLILAMAGLIGGRPATTHHLGMEVLGAFGAVPVDARVVDDGDLVTGASVTSTLDLALYLVERELGPRVARELEKLIAYERRGVVWHDRGLAPVNA